MRRIARVMLMRDRIGGEPENRYSDDRGREHYDNGRYAPMRNEYGSQKAYSRYDAQSNYARMGNSQSQSNWQGGEPNMNMIGFRIDGEADMQPKNEYDPKRESYISFPRGDEMSNRGGKMEKGLGRSEEAPEITKEIAEKWVKSMQNSDGSTGEHWTMEQTDQIMKSRGYKCNPAEFFLVVNMLYSDYYKVFHKYGIETPDFYAEMAKAWIDDPDAKENKTAEYFCHVVKHRE